MKHIFTFIILAFSFSFGFAQNAPVDFEASGNGASWTWTVFENSTNLPLEIIPNPVSGVGNTTTTVAKFNALDAGMDWAGCETTDIGSFTFDVDNSVVKLWVYKDVVSQVKIKFEGTGGNIESNDITNTVTGQWEELTFDFSAVIGNAYNKLVIFPDYAARDQDNIIYFDEMTFNAGSAPAVPAVAAPVPSHESVNVISIYSGTYTNIAGTIFTPGWGQSTAVSFVDIVGNETMKYANFNFQGTQLAANQDMSAMEFMHVDVWTEDATVVKVTPISATTGEFLLELNPLAQGSWNSYDIPVGDFTGVSMANIHQLKFDGQAGVNPSILYVDNIFFWKNPTAAGSDATLSDLKVDGTTVVGFDANTLNYNIELPYGSTIVPTATATTTDVAANHVVNPVAALPGTTEVVVTAQDGVTILNYNVIFSLADAVPTAGAPMPTHDETDDNVVSIYSDSYTNLVSTNFNPNWSQSTQVAVDEQVGGNNTLVYTNLNYQGTNLGSADGLPQDFSGKDFLHVDFWTPDATTLNFWLNSQTTAEQKYELTVQTEQWVSVDIPLTYYSGLGLDLSDIFQFKVDGGDGSATVYFDNWYFWEVSANADASLSDLQVDGTTVNGFVSDVFSYDVELAEGTTVVPTVTATPTNVNATEVVNAAAALPGTTEVVVTAVDGITILTYAVNFDFPAPTAPTIAAEDPTEEPVDVISIYSDTYTDLAGTDFNPGWGQSTVVSTEDIGGNEMMKYAGFNYQGTALSGAQDISIMEYLHVDVWTADATVLKLTPISITAPAEFLVELTPLTQGTWNSYDIPVGDFTGVSMANIHQLKFDGQAGVNPSNIYLDNIYFWKTPTAAGSDATLSDLQVDGTTVTGFSANIVSYNIELPYGTTTVPIVTATTTDPNAGYVINDAAALPGTTDVVVTADDDVTIITYSVNFSLASPVPTTGAPMPSHDETDDNVVSIYSDSYTNLVSTNFNPNWSQSTQVSVDEQVGGNNTLVYTSLNYQGTNLGSADGLPQDFSGKDFLHVDFWTPDATTLNFWLNSQTTAEQKYELTVQTEQWVSVDIPLTYYSGLGLDLSDIFQFKVDGGDGSATVYFDNWYFWEVSANADASLSDLQMDGTTVNGFASDIFSYDVELAEGTTVVPTVTATTTNANANEVINAAPALPGTTEVVVTAEDGITSLTYSVNFGFPVQTGPTVAAELPTEEAVDVISIYSDTYIDLAGTDFNPGWGQSTVVSTEDIGGNEMMKYATFNYQGTQLAGNQDMSIMEFLHVDIWTADATVLKLSPISASTGEFLYELTPLTQGTWNSYDIPVEDFTDLSFADIHQFKFDGQAGVSPSTIYLDNIYLWKNPTAAGSDATLSDLQMDGTTVTGFSANMMSYDMELPYGTTIIPTVTATTTDANATAVITDATALPGTTEVVVTADDDVTSLTYSVNFTLANAVPTVGASIPSHDETDDNVFSIYSDSYTNLAETNFNPSWGQSTQVVVDEQVGGNNTLVYSNFNYQGTNLGSADGSPQDFSAKDYLHIDFWTADATAINFFLISQTTGEISYPLTVSQEEWVSVDIPLSHFTSAGLSLEDIFQFKLDGGTGSTIYFDNWYFWEVSANTDATLSDLMVDGTTVDGFASDVFSYEVQLEDGTTVVPTVTATTTNGNANEVINAATALPGTTEVVVTAEDGITSLTYSVNFGFPVQTGPTVAAELPTEEAVDVISIYSDTYTDLAGTDFNPGWGQSTVVSTEDIGGNEMMKYATFNYQGTQLAGNQDLSIMEFLHVDIWTADATVVKLSPISATTGEFLYELTPLSQGTWNSYDIPVEDFTDLSFADIHQLKFDGQAGVNPSNIYLDNIYFWKTPTASGSDATLSDLQVDGVTITGFSANMMSYDMELPYGTTIIPTVTATTTDPNAEFDITDATALPGATDVVVTADDEVTIVTYSVNFTLANAVPTVGAPIPSHDETDDNVFSIYSDSYTNLEATNFNPSWGQSTQVVVDEQVGGNNTLVYSNFNYQGTNLGSADGSPQDFAGHDYFHLDFWTADATAINFFLISQTTGEISYPLTVTQEEWVSVDIPLSHFTSAGLSLEDVFQFKFDGGTGSTIYFDNWYFWEVSANTDATLTDLQVDGITVDGFTSGVLSYEVELVEGTTVVPVVSATTTNASASYSVNDATVLPGTTEVVVTAEDGITNLTYTVEFVFPMQTGPTVAAEDPTEAAVDVISIYSDSYTDLAGTDFNPGWGQSTVVSTEDIGGNEMMKYASFNYQGTQLDGNQDLSIMEFLHVDIWTADATVVKLSPISATTGEFLYELTPLSQGTWNSYDIPVEDFTDLSFADIHQLKFDGQAGVNPSNIYLDNIYFWKTPTASGSDATLSDLQVDGTTVTGFSANMMSYDMELPYGTTIIPTVTATTTDPNAEFDITDATALPGATDVVVTADDDVTILTYSVNFTLANAVPMVGAPVPTHDETDDNVFSIYSDSYTNLEATNFNPSWGQSTQVVVDEQVGGNNTLVYSNFNYQGTNLGSADGSPQDFAGHDYFHLDFWTADATAINFFLISQTTGEVSYPLTVTQEEWVSVDIPLSHFTSAGLSLEDVFQFKFDGGTGSFIYFDNWYFWNLPTSIVDIETSQLSVFPNPTTDLWNINSDENIESISVYTLAGKQVLSITPNMSSVQVDASQLPKGVYVSKIITPTGIKSFKLIRK